MTCRFKRHQCFQTGRKKRGKNQQKKLYARQRLDTQVPAEKKVSNGISRVAKEISLWLNIYIEYFMYEYLKCVHLSSEKPACIARGILIVQWPVAVAIYGIQVRSSQDEVLVTFQGPSCMCVWGAPLSHWNERAELRRGGSFPRQNLSSPRVYGTPLA